MNRRQSLCGFTLLEVIVALALVGILMAAITPYLKDALTQNEGDRITNKIEQIVSSKRLHAIESGNPTQIDLKKDLDLPDGWQLQIKGLNDDDFHDAGDQPWIFDEEGIASPMKMKLQKKENNDPPLILSFDPITGELTS